MITSIIKEMYLIIILYVREFYNSTLLTRCIVEASNIVDMIIDMAAPIWKAVALYNASGSASDGGRVKRPTPARSSSSPKGSLMEAKVKIFVTSHNVAI